jgi:hypothetical protein
MEKAGDKRRSMEINGRRTERGVIVERPKAFDLF